MRQITLKRLGLGVLFGAMLIGLGSVSAEAANSVVVSSLTVTAGQSGVEIAVKLANDVPIRNLVIPFMFREVTSGCFPDSVRRGIRERLTTALTDIRIFDQKYDTTGSCKETQAGGFVGRAQFVNDTLSHPVNRPQHGFLVSIGRFLGANLTPGSDVTGSIYVIVKAPTTPGSFEVDTTCINPANHLVFVQDDGTQFGFKIVPAFTKGVIKVACAKGFSAVPSGPIPTDGAEEQLGRVTLGWNPVVDSCGVPASSYDVLWGNSCSSLDPASTCTGINVNSCEVTGLLANTDYFWKVRVTDFMGRQMDGPCWTFKTGNVAVQYLGGDGIPRAYSLDQNYPNPFNASTVISFNIKHDGHVRLDVFNILGQKVKTLVDEFRQLGPQAVDWDGTDAGGRVVPTGLYFYRLVTSDYTDIKKMVLLK